MDWPWKKEQNKEAATSQPSEKGGGYGNEEIAEKALIRPRLTEKTTQQMGDGVYVFDVQQWANKRMIKQAIQYLYQVNPRKVRTITKKPRPVKIRGRAAGTQSGEKKAYVYLYAGDRIDFV